MLTQVKATRAEAAALDEAKQAESAAAYAAAAEARELQSLLDQVNDALRQERYAPPGRVPSCLRTWTQACRWPLLPRHIRCTYVNRQDSTPLS